MSFVGLDAGTTGIKALVVNENGKVLDLSYQGYKLRTPFEGWCELNPDEIWGACKKVLYDVLSRFKDIEAIAVSSHAQAVVPVDKDGNALYNFISTVDTRTGKELEYWKDNFDEAELYRTTGLPFSAIYTANKIMWLRSNAPEVFEKTCKFLCVQDFINWHLTGNAVIDQTLAGRGMLLDSQSFKWDARILDIIGIDSSMLAEIIPSGRYIGDITKDAAKEIGVIIGKIAVISGAHDQTCGCIGSGILYPGQVMNSTGTVEVLQTISPCFVPAEKILKYHFPCSPYIVSDNYLIMSINNSGGALLQYYLENFCEAERTDAVSKGLDPFAYLIDTSSEEISNVYFLPHLNGAETPIQDPDSSCSIMHIRSNTKKADVTRGLLDSMAYEVKLNLEAFEELGCIHREIRAIGGGNKTDRFLQIKADVTQLPVISPDVKEAAALGAAIIASVGVGAFSDLKQAIECMVRIRRVFEPDVSLAEKYREHYEEFKMLYPMLSGFNKRVSERIKAENK